MLIIFTLVSCSWRNEDQSVIEETGEIIEWYADTLEWSVQDSKAVKELIESNQQNLKDNLNVY